MASLRARNCCTQDITISITACLGRCCKVGQIDANQFPLVFLRPNEDGEERSTSKPSPEAQFEAILDCGRHFVLITTGTPTDGPDETAEERKQKALFFKRNKDRMRRFCVGAIVVEGDRPTSVPMRLAAQAMGKAFGFNCHFVANEARAIDQAMRLVEAAAAWSSLRLSS